jgi:hypothetical protein
MFLLQRGWLARMRALITGVALAGVMLVAPAQSVRALAAAGPALRTVAFGGYTFRVPRSWPVVYLARHPRTCVRFDRHAVYFGTPGRNESCPAGLIGTTEALLISPAAARSARSSVEDPVAGQITVQAPRIRITATFSTEPWQIYQILRSASLPEPDIEMPRPAVMTPLQIGPRSRGRQAVTHWLGSRRLAPLPADITNYRGFGFDACAAPSSAYMRAWRRFSRYRAIGVYIGGADRTCAQPNLTRKWLRQQALAGWHFMPTYVGPQANLGQLTSPARQATAAANDAVAQAQRLGFRRRTLLYYDMEGYPAPYGTAALIFFSAWTARIHRLGYASGIYSSTNSGIADLVSRYHRCSFVLPDVVFFGHWNGNHSTRDPVLRRSKWLHHRRLHQYAGHISQAFGGDTINADEDYLDVILPQPRHPAGGPLPPAPLGRGCAPRRARHQVVAFTPDSVLSAATVINTTASAVLKTIKAGRPVRSTLVAFRCGPDCRPPARLDDLPYPADH